ncbi:MAG: putative nitrogen fixation protein NifT [bacterium]|nr:putative nitrogen fixation protein NifT [bacterium]
MVSKAGDGYSIYIPKKDLEAKVVSTEAGVAFGGTWELENGDKLYIEPLDAEPKLPLTMVAKRVD